MLSSNLIKLSGTCTRCAVVQLNFTAGLKYLKPPPNFDHIELPEKPRLRMMERVPQYPPSVKAPRMFKRLDLMRGPELVHNTLLHEQFGIVATSGGRLRWGHFEMIRNGISRKLDMKRMFAVWRVDAPWQPVTKRGLGVRMGGGKGPINHYVTPVKAGRVIVEVAGKCEFKEVKGFLDIVAAKLPFKAEVVSHEMLEEMKAKEKRLEEENVNPYTFKYILLNNLCGFRVKHMSKADYNWFGKYV